MKIYLWLVMLILELFYVTGEGLDDGVEVLYEMILKRRKMRKKKK